MANPWEHSSDPKAHGEGDKEKELVRVGRRSSGQEEERYLDSGRPGPESGPESSSLLSPAEIKKDPELLRNKAAIHGAVDAALQAMNGREESLSKLRYQILPALQPLRSGKAPLRFGPIEVIPQSPGIRVEVLFRKEDEDPADFHSVFIFKAGIQLKKEDL